MMKRKRVYRRCRAILVPQGLKVTFGLVSLDYTPCGRKTLRRLGICSACERWSVAETRLRGTGSRPRKAER
jgi:hypothetical protein